MASTPKPKGRFTDFLAPHGQAAATADMPVRKEDVPAAPAAEPEAPAEPAGAQPAVVVPPATMQPQAAAAAATAAVANEPETKPIVEPKVGLNLKVDASFKDLVEGLSYRHRRPMVAIVKEAIDLWVAQNGPGER